MRLNTLKLPVAFSSAVIATLITVAVAAQAPAPQPKPISRGEMLKQGYAVLTAGTTMSQTVSANLRQATEESDMLKVTCLNDKLTQIDGNVKTVRTHINSLRKATDAGVQAHEHTMLLVLKQKLEVLGQQAAQCVGKDLFSTGTTTTTTDIDWDMIPYEDDPSFPPTILPPTLPTLPPPQSEIR